MMSILDLLFGAPKGMNKEKRTKLAATLEAERQAMIEEINKYSESTGRYIAPDTDARTVNQIMADDFSAFDFDPTIERPMIIPDFEGGNPYNPRNWIAPDALVSILKSGAAVRTPLATNYDALETMANAMGGGIASGAFAGRAMDPNTVGMFMHAPPERFGEVIKLAEKMGAEGKTDKEIWKATGDLGEPLMYDKFNGEWIREFSDENLRVDVANNKIIHPEYQAEFGSVPSLETFSEPANKELGELRFGHYDPNTDAISLNIHPDAVERGSFLGGLAHEMNHAVANPSRQPAFPAGYSNHPTAIHWAKEGLRQELANARGISQRWMRDNKDVVDDYYRTIHESDLMRLYAKSRRMKDYSESDSPGRMFSQIRSATDWLHDAPFQMSTDPAVRDMANTLLRRWNQLPKRPRKAERDTFLRDHAFALSRLFEKAIGPDYMLKFRADPRNLQSMERAYTNRRKRAGDNMEQFRNLESRSKELSAKNQRFGTMKPFDVYERAYGEALSRATDRRVNMTKAQRAETFPEMDVPAEDLFNYNPYFADYQYSIGKP